MTKASHKARWRCLYRLPLLCLLLIAFRYQQSFSFSHLAATPAKAAVPKEWLPVDDLLFKDDSASCVLPFTRVGSLIVIKAKVDSVEGNFILDTGAPYLVLNLVYFRHYPMQMMPHEEQTSMSGTGGMVHRTDLRQFSIGGIGYRQLQADLIDLGHLENSKGIRILGLIGYRLLERCEMVIDYEKSLLHLHRIGRKEKQTYNSPHLQQDTAYTTLPIDIIDNQIVAQAEVQGKKIKFVLDSGAETNIMDSRLPQAFFEKVAITGRLTVRGTGNATVEALQGELEELTIGGNNLFNLPVMIANLERTCFSASTCANGVLGFEFMPLRKIGFNFMKRKMYLWKQSVPI